MRGASSVSSALLLVSGLSVRCLAVGRCRC